MTLLANAPVAMMITLMVILIGSLLFGLAPGRTRTIQPLGPQRKRLALGVVLIGLCTAGLPMVILDPPLLNKSQRTPLNIALKVYQREFPVSRGSLDNSIEMAFIFLLMLLALVALSIPGLPKFTPRDQRLRLRSQDAGEVLAPLVPKYVRMAILRVWVFETGPAWWILPWVMPALLAICFAKNLDS